jgi:hypothetical protein
MALCNILKDVGDDEIFVDFEDSMITIFGTYIKRKILVYLDNKTLGMLALSSRLLYDSAHTYRLKTKYFDAKRIFMDIKIDNRSLNSLPRVLDVNSNVMKIFCEEISTNKIASLAYRILSNANKIRIDIRYFSFFFNKNLELLLRLIRSVRSIDILLDEQNNIDNMSSFFEQCRHIKDKVKNIKLINPIGLDITTISQTFDLEKFSIFTHDTCKPISLKDVYIRCSKLYFNVSSFDCNSAMLDEKCKDVTLGWLRDRRNIIISKNVKKMTMIFNERSFMTDSPSPKNIENLDNVTHLIIVTQENNKFLSASEISRELEISLPFSNIQHLTINGFIPNIEDSKFKDTLKTITYNPRGYTHYSANGIKFPFPINKDVIIRQRYMMYLTEYIATRPNLYSGYLNKPIRTLPKKY